MPRDRNVRKALALQREETSGPSQELCEGLCGILRPDAAMKERLERHDDPPRCPGTCAICRFFAEAKAAGKPVEIDLGSGYGRFGRAHAQRNPGCYVLGLEQDEARVARCDVQARKLGIGNLRYVICEARYALEYCIPAASVSAVFILFPDPWPKDRHARNRIFRRPNMDLIHRLLIPGGLLHCATDHGAYFEQLLEVMGENPQFERVAAYARSDEEKTDFECKFLAQGKTIREASWRSV